MLQLALDWQRSKTTVLRVAAGAAAIVATVWGLALIPHTCAGLAMLPGALLPLVFSRGAALGRAAAKGSKRTAIMTLRSDAMDESRAAQGDLIALRRANERLTKELCDLRAAYAELAIEAADRSDSIDRLNFLAYHDALTSLPNLDHFKKINDTMGHAAGDRVLTEIAARIAGCIRESDTASRLGGDEFVLVYTTADGVRDAARIESRLLRAIGAPIDIDGESVTIGASLGMSLYPRDGTDPAQLIAAADEQMYSAKLARR